MIINGSPSQDVAIADRGFNFGDGHFTTIKIAAGQALLLDLHLARLQQACAALAIEFTQWNELLAVITQQALVLRGGVYSDWAREGIELMLCEYQQTVNPALAGLKTLNRLDQVMIKQELDANGMNDGLVCSTDGYVIETSVANVFWVIGDKVYTPSTERSGVEGVMKTHISNLLNKLGFSLKTGDYTISNVLAADEIFITNSVMEVVPVKSILKLGTQDNISAIGYDLSVNDSSVWRLLQQELHG
ncbi:aminotransferase class IV [Moritella viscosa]